MTRQMGTVVLMRGRPGAGKTTHAMELVRRGYVRLSTDEVVRQRLGRRDAGPVLEAGAFDRLQRVADARRPLPAPGSADGAVAGPAGTAADPRSNPSTSEKV